MLSDVIRPRQNKVDALEKALTSNHSRKRGRPKQIPQAAPFAGEHETEAAIGTLSRGLAILRCFRAEDPVIGTHEIAHRTNLPKSTASRIAGTLAKLGYLQFVPSTGKYAISSQVLTLCYAAIGRSRICEIARPLTADLITSGGCGVAISIRDGAEMMFIDLTRPPNTIMLNLTTGSRVPILETAAGRAYLAALDGKQREELLQQLGFTQRSNWKREKKELDIAIALARQHGYATAIGTWKPEHNAIATVVRDPITAEIFTYSLGGLASMLPAQRLLDDFAPRLTASAETISMRLGATTR